MEEEVVKSHASKKVWLPIIVVLAVVAVVMVLIIVGTRTFLAESAEPAPVLIEEQSEYVMFESRGNEVLLTYRVTLQNNTGKDLEDFTMRAVLQKDSKSGFVLSPDATVRKEGERESTFSMKAGETETFDLVLTASYYPRQGLEPSKALPLLFAIYPDGSEGQIQTK